MRLSPSYTPRKLEDDEKPIGTQLSTVMRLISAVCLKYFPADHVDPSVWFTRHRRASRSATEPIRWGVLLDPSPDRVPQFPDATAVPPLPPGPNNDPTSRAVARDARNEDL